MKKQLVTGALALFSLATLAQTKTICVERQLDSLDGIDASIGSRTDHIDKNFGNHPSNLAFGGTGSNVGSKEQDWRGLTKWEFLGTLDKNVIIDSASITFFENTVNQYHNTFGENASKLFLITESWKEDSVTWNTQPAYNDTISAPIAKQTDGFGSVKVDISNLVSLMISQELPNNGFLVRLNNEDPYKTLGLTSSDYSIANKKPIWKVCYHSIEDIVYTKNGDIECATIIPDSTTGIDANISNRSDFINKNFQASYNRLMGGTGNNVGSAEQDWRALSKLTFLDKLPKDITIESASLVIHDYTGPGKVAAHSSNSSKIHLITESWKEDSVTWNTQPAFDASKFVSVATLAPDYDSTTIDITPLVKEIVEEQYPNNGFLFKLDQETPYKGYNFVSSDHKDQLLRPTWKVCYRQPSLLALDDIFASTSAENALIISPNPSTGLITFEKEISGTVYSTYGRVIRSFTNKITLDLNGENSGIYIVETIDGKKAKFIIE